MKEITSSQFKNRILLNKNNVIPEILKCPVLDNEVNGFRYFSIAKNSFLYNTNKRISEYLAQDIPTNSASVGFKKGKSYLDFFLPHVKNQYFLRLDIKNFFHSIPYENVSQLIDDIFPEAGDEESPRVIVSDVITKSIKEDDSSDKEKRIVPVGYPSSPVVSNIIFRKIDILIQKECIRRGFEYTRYADDMLFSSRVSDVHEDRFVKEISYYVSLIGLKLNYKKTLKHTKVLSLNSYVIDSRIRSSCHMRVSNKKMKKLYKLSYMMANQVSHFEILKKVYGLNVYKVKFLYKPSQRYLSKYARDQLINKIIGTRSYLINILKFFVRHDCSTKTMIDSINLVIKSIESYLKLYI